MLESDFVPEQAKEALREEYARLNPVKLKRKIIRLQERLDELLWSKNRPKHEEHYINLDYISREATNVTSSTFLDEATGGLRPDAVIGSKD